MEKTRCGECGALYWVGGGYDDRGEYVRDYCTMDGRSVEACEDCGTELPDDGCDPGRS